nr:unnamed protein product [Digitaria exilis]
MKRQRKNIEQMLPKDMLADVLRRLAPYSLAVCRCVCKAWLAVIDDHKLLRTDLLPHSLGGILVNFNMLERTEFISCPAAGCSAISVNLCNMACPSISVDDHCNGLLLLFDSVANPATRQWARLPPQPPRMGIEAFYDEPYLMFDPAISPYYEVFLMPVVASWAELNHSMMETEWPPILFRTRVFSSRTGCWEERSFVRQGDPAGTIGVMQEACTMVKRYSVYWCEALYLHCKNGFFCKISVAKNEYQVIKPPDEFDKFQEPYLGKSEKGVYCAIVDLNFRLRVWILDESSGQMEWVLKHENNLLHVLVSQEFDDGAWTFEDLNHYEYCRKDNYGEEHVQTKLSNHLSE